MDDQDCEIDLPPDGEEKVAETTSVIGFIGTGLSNIFSSDTKEEVIQVPQQQAAPPVVAVRETKIEEPPPARLINLNNLDQDL